MRAKQEAYATEGAARRKADSLPPLTGIVPNGASVGGSNGHGTAGSAERLGFNDFYSSQQSQQQHLQGQYQKLEAGTPKKSVGIFGWLFGGGDGDDEADVYSTPRREREHTGGRHGNAVVPFNGGDGYGLNSPRSPGPRPGSPGYSPGGHPGVGGLYDSRSSKFNNGGRMKRRRGLALLSPPISCN